MVIWSLVPWSYDILPVVRGEKVVARVAENSDSEFTEGLDYVFAVVMSSERLFPGSYMPPYIHRPICLRNVNG